MILRPDQEEVTHRLREGYRQGKKRQILVAETGFGKTVVASFYTREAVKRGLRVLVGTHRGEILDQISRALSSVGVPHGTIASGERMMPRMTVQLASIPTLIRRFDAVKPPDLVILDEVAHCVSKTWASIFAEYPQAYFLGLTATPERLDGRGLGEFFEDIVRGPSMSWLIEQKLLARPRYFGVPPSSAPDTSLLHKVAGDFNRGESEELMDRPTITGDAVQHYQRLCPDRTAVAFCVSLKHAAHVCDQFRGAGIPTQIIDGTMSKEERRSILYALRSGTTRVLVSVDLVSEGFDLPAVGAVILLRPTASLALHRQQIGRGLRAKPDGGDALVLDHVGNTLRHGPVEEGIDWSLDGGAAKRIAKDRPVITVQCPHCYVIYGGGVECPECGFVRESKPREIEHRNGVLRELTPEQIAQERARKARHMEEGRCTSLADFQKIAKERGYRSGWAFHRWQLRKTRGGFYRGSTDQFRPTLKQPDLIPA